MTRTPRRERTVESVIRALPELSDPQAQAVCDMAYAALSGVLEVSRHEDDAA